MVILLLRNLLVWIWTFFYFIGSILFSLLLMNRSLPLLWLRTVWAPVYNKILGIEIKVIGKDVVTGKDLILLESEIPNEL